MGDILWVTDNGTISTVEQTVYNHLNSKHTITLHDSSSAAPASYETNYDMVLISGDLADGPNDPGSTYEPSSIPVLVLHNDVAEAMLMSNTASTTTMGDGATNNMHMWVINDTSTIPSNAGWSNGYEQIVDTADVTVGFLVKAGGSTSGENIVGRVANGGSQMCVEFEATDLDNNGDAYDGPRVFFGMEAAMEHLTANGLAGIDAAIVNFFGIAEDTGPEEQSVAGTVTPAGTVATAALKKTSQAGAVSFAGTLSTAKVVVRRPDGTVAAGDWDTGPTGGQSLHGYTSDVSDSTWIESVPTGV